MVTKNLQKMKNYRRFAEHETVYYHNDRHQPTGVAL